MRLSALGFTVKIPQRLKHHENCFPLSPPPSRRGAGRVQSGRDGAVLRQRGRDELPVVLAAVLGRRVGDERLRRRVVRHFP